MRAAASQIYYSLFHAARAAITTRSLYSKTHSGLIGLFEQTFGPAPILDRALKVRGEADYSLDEFAYGIDELEALMSDAEEFIDRCRAIVSTAVESGADEHDPPPDI